MGCSVSNEVAIAELNQIVLQLSNDNIELTKEHEKLKNKQKFQLEEKCTLKDIQHLNNQLESELTILQSIASQLYKSSRLSSSFLDNKIKEILRIKEILDNRVIEITNLLEERDELKAQYEELEANVIESEQKILELEEINFTTEDLRMQHYALHQNVSELESEKETLLAEIQEAENTLNNLNQEIKDSGLEDKSKAPDPSNYEVLLGLTDSEVNIELQKVDAELDALMDQIDSLKTKEKEYQNLENLINVNEIKSNLQRNLSLRTQFKGDQNRIDLFEQEKFQVADTFYGFKKRGTVEGGVISDRLDSLVNFRDKKKLGDEERVKGISEDLVSNARENLLKAKKLTLNMNEFD